VTLYETVPATDDHIEELALTMCQEDVDECWAAMHYIPREALVRAVKVSQEPITGLVDGEVACIFGVGVTSNLTGWGSPWMLASSLLRDHPRAFLSKNKIWMEYQQARWSRLENFVDARHHVAVRWLEWMGFDLDEPAPYGLDGMDFHKFHWEGDHV